jgi:hypothetical protein
MTSERPSDPGLLTAEELASVRRSYLGARLLPGRAYHDEAIHEWERANFFRADWVIVGRANEAPDPGTYFVTELDGESIIVVRGRDGELRAFYNVCRHRGTAVRAMRHGRSLPMPLSRLDLRSRREARPRQAHRRPRGLQPRGIQPGADPARDVAGFRLPQPGRSRRTSGRPARRSGRPRRPIRLWQAPACPEDRVRGRGELEVHRRELLGVLSLPGSSPAAQQADAVRPRG